MARVRLDASRPRRHLPHADGWWTERAPDNRSCRRLRARTIAGWADAGLSLVSSGIARRVRTTGGWRTDGTCGRDPGTRVVPQLVLRRALDPVLDFRQQESLQRGAARGGRPVGHSDATPVPR